MQKLLVSVRGKVEALEAISGGAHIIDAEYPKSALGTVYPLNLWTIRKATPDSIPVSTNIGEKQAIRSTAAQAAVGVALAGADIIKVGLAGLERREAQELMKRIIRNVKKWFPDKKLIATFFADYEIAQCVEPTVIPAIGSLAGANGVLIDTFDKTLGRSLLEYISLSDISKFVIQCHEQEIEAWVAGSLTKDHLQEIWKTEVDVVCVRSSACNSIETEGRFGSVKADIVEDLVKTVPH